MTPPFLSLALSLLSLFAGSREIFPLSGLGYLRSQRSILFGQLGPNLLDVASAPGHMFPFRGRASNGEAAVSGSAVTPTIKALARFAHRALMPPNLFRAPARSPATIHFIRADTTSPRAGYS